MIEAYLQHEKERAKQGIPPLPLTPEQTADLVKLLVKPPKGKEQFLGKGRAVSGSHHRRRSAVRVDERKQAKSLDLVGQHTHREQRNRCQPDQVRRAQCP